MWLTMECRRREGFEVLSGSGGSGGGATAGSTISSGGATGAGDVTGETMTAAGAVAGISGAAGADGATAAGLRALRLATGVPGFCDGVVMISPSLRLRSSGNPNPELPYCNAALTMA